MDKIKLLFVDDDPNIRKIIKLMVTHNENIDYYEAENGETGFVMFSKIDPDILITDLNMPGKDGMWLLDKLRDNLADTICVIMTGFLQDYPDVIYRKSIRVLPKPVNGRLFSEIVNTAVDIVSLKKKLNQLTESVN